MYLLACNIEALSIKVTDISELDEQLGKLAVLKRVVKNTCRVIISHKEEKHEDGTDLISMDAWGELYRKVGSEKFKKERHAIERGRKFVTAFYSPMGKAVEKSLLLGLQEGYESVFKGDITVAAVYEMQVYTDLISKYSIKIQVYKDNIDRVNKIIYKEN